MTSLIVSLLGEVTQVKSAFGDLQHDFKRFRQHAEDQTSEIKAQLQFVKEEVSKTSLQISESRRTDLSPSASVIPQTEFQSGVRVVQDQLCAWESKLEDGWKLVTEGVKSSILKNEAVMESIQQSVTTSVAPSASSVEQVLEVVESKLKSYAEMTREMTRDTQTSILQDREKELAARDLRAKNLRIIGMTESEGENVQEVVVDLLRDTLQLDAPKVDHAIRVGKGDRGPRPILIRFATVDARNNALSHRSKLRGKSLWLDPDLTPLQVEDRKKEIQKVKEASSAGLIAYMRDGRTTSDLLALVETWEVCGKAVTFPGFTHLETLWNERKNSRGRGFGDVGVWVRDGSGLRVEVEKTDYRKQFLCLKLFTKKCATPAFLFVAYYAPLGAPIYKRLGSGEDPLSALTEAVIAVHELGPVWVLGNFNSRVGDAQSLEVNEEGVAVWRNSDADESWCRSAKDEGRNDMSEFFMQFAAAGDLTIVNGTAPFPDTRSITCRTHNGSSTMDFLLACKSARDRILDFSFGPFSPESDHRPLRCTLMGFEREIRRQYRRSKVGVCLDVMKRNQYETMLENKLHGRELTSGALANIITGVAKEVLTAKQPRDKGWFDEDCRIARCKAMSAVD
ncbi:hypothetical protein R1sor_019902 [Riccia sorocarpa]|uniref:Endonuclease/exonuclease/phosphatase domain-containing protein n=1 Tax=Riccia sorocarpa TaxID=122646 RepID=A0ABD3IDT5_9MARC